MLSITLIYGARGSGKTTMGDALYDRTKAQPDNPVKKVEHFSEDEFYEYLNDNEDVAVHHIVVCNNFIPRTPFQIAHDTGISIEPFYVETRA